MIVVMFAIGVIMEDMWYCLVNWALINMFMCGCSVFSVAYSCAVVLAHDFQRILHYLWFPRSAQAGS